MAILANDGRMALEGVSQYNYSVNQTNLSNSVAVTGVQDSIYSTWAGIYGSQLNLPYNNIQSNSYLNLYTRHMGGWATVDLGTGAGDVYDTVALQRTGDWVLNFQGGDKLIAGSAVAVAPQSNAYIYVNAYITSNATFNTDGSLKLVAGKSGTQNVSFESGLTGNQAWDHRTNGNTPGAWGSSPGFDGPNDDQWNVTGAAIANGIYSTTQHDNTEQSGSNTGAGLTLNAAGDVNGTSTVTLGDGTDNLLLLNNTRTVTDYWWQSFWIFGGRWNAYTYVENAWTIYRDGTNWKAYNNFKDYTVTIANDVETVYYSFVNDDGSIDYQVFKNDGSIDHYSNGFPPLEGSGGSAPTPNTNPVNPLSLGDSGFVPSTDTADTGNNTANIQVVAPKGATVSFLSDSGNHNEGDTTLGLRTFTTFGAQQLSFAARDSSGESADPAAAEIGTIHIQMSSTTYGDSQYKLYLGTNGGGDVLAAQDTRVLAYGFNGNDTLNGSPDRDTLIGGEGNDILNGGSGRDSLFGGSGNDTINGGNDSDYIEGGAGNDVIIGSGDSIFVTVGGGSIVDTLLGGAGNDTITGGVGDFVQGGANDDRLTAADTGTTYLVDNEGANTIITNGGLDAVYFSASNKGNYTNTVLNGGSEVVTLLLEHRSTTRSANDTDFTASDTPTSAYVYVPDAQTVFVDASSAGTADVINFYGGDRYDTGYWDKTVNTFLFGTWYQWRNFYTIDGRDQSGNAFGSLNTPSLVLDWASDGEMYYGNPSGILAPPDPDAFRFEVGSAAGFMVSQVGYKGYFTFYNARVNTSTIFYVDAGGDNYVNAGEMTYLGVMNGQAGSSVKYGSFVNGQFSLGNTPAPATLPLAIVSGIDLAQVDDTFVSGIDRNDDNITMTTTGLTLTANVASGVTSSNVNVYEWIDADADGAITSSELTKLSVSASSVYAWVDANNNGIIDQQGINDATNDGKAKDTNNVYLNELVAVGSPDPSTITGYVYKADISLSDGDHKILMTQTLGNQTSDLDAGSALTISVRSDFVPPEFSTFSAVTLNDTQGQLNVTSTDNIKTANYLKYDLVNATDQTILSSQDATDSIASAITVNQQTSVWNGIVKVTDDAGNSTLSDVNVALGTGKGDTLTATGAFNAIYGFDGNDVITSQEGKDSLFGGAGDDTINSGSGDDLVSGGSGADTIVITGTSSVTNTSYNWPTFNPWSRDPDDNPASSEFGGWLPTKWSITLGTGSFTIDFNSSPFLHIVGWDLSNNFVRIQGSLSSSPMTFSGWEAFRDYVNTTLASQYVYGNRSPASVITWTFNAGVLTADVGPAGLVYDNTGTWNAFDHSYSLVGTGGAATLSLSASDTIDGGSNADTLDISSVSGPVTVDDAMFTNVSNVETLKLGDGNGNSVTLSTEAAQAGIVNVIGGIANDTVDVTTLQMTNVVLGAGTNVVKMANGAQLNTVSAVGGTAALEIANNASVTLTVAAHNLFNATNITAGTLNTSETIKLSGIGNVTADADVETYDLGNEGRTITLAANSAQTIVGGTASDELVLGGTTYTGKVTAVETITMTTGGDIKGAKGANNVVGESTGATTLAVAGSVSMTAAQHAGFTNINDTDGPTSAETITITTQATALALDADIETYVLGNFTNSVTLGGAAQNVTGNAGNDTINTGALTTISGQINGVSGTDIVVVDADSTLSATLSNIDEVQLASGVDITTSISNNALITTAAGTNIVTLSDVGTATGSSEVEKYVLANGGNTFTSGNTAHSITGGTGNDTITGGQGNDTINGGDGNDLFYFSGTTDADVIDGGNGSTDALWFSGNTDFTQSTTTNVEHIILEGGVTATFAGNELSGKSYSIAAGNVVTASTLQIQVTAATGNFSTLNFNGTLLTGSTAWSPSVFSDRVVINGDGTDNTIVGTSVVDIITGGGGVDNLSGGNGDDLFVVASATDDAVGENYDGGANTDTLRVTGTTAVNLSDDTLTSIETLDLTTDTSAQTVVMSMAQVEAITTLNAAVNDVIRITDTSVSLARLAALEARTTGLIDATNVTSTSGSSADALLMLVTNEGTAGNKVDMASNVVVTLTDASVSASDTNLIANATTGILTATISDGAVTATLGAITNVNAADVITFTTTSTTVDASDYVALKAKVDTFTTTAVTGAVTEDAADIGTGGATVIAALDDLGNDNDVTITGAISAADADLINNKTTGVLSIVGTVGNNTLDITGATEPVALLGDGGDDIITGGNGNDTITGGTGADTMVGGAGADTFRYTSTSDTGTSISSLSTMDVIEGFLVGTDSLDLSLLTLTSGPSVTADASDADSYIVEWTSGGVTNYVQLKDTGTTGGIALTNNGGVITAAAAPAMSFTTVTVSSTGIDVVGSGPFRAYFGKLAQPVVFNDTSTYWLQSGNNGNSQYSYALTNADFQSTTEAKTGYLTIRSTSGGATITYDAIVYSGDSDTANTYTADLTAALPDGTGGNTPDFAIIYGGNSTDNLTGSSGNDIIFGGDGADIITGGAGADNLTGGSGSDTFVFAATNTLNGSDTITDFTAGVTGDVLDFTGVRAVVDGNQAGTNDDFGLFELHSMQDVSVSGTSVYGISENVAGGGDGVLTAADLVAVTGSANGKIVVANNTDAIVIVGAGQSATTVNVYRIYDSDATATTVAAIELLATITLVGTTTIDSLLAANIA